MNASEVISSKETAGTSVAKIDMKLEAVVIPVSDVDRAKGFYGNLGWRLDADSRFDNGFRVVQYTPPGSGTAIQFGSKITTAKAGSADGLYLVVSDIEAARNQLAARDVEVSEVFHPGTPGAQFQVGGTDAGLQDPRRITLVIALSRPSATQTAIAGFSKRSQLDFLAASPATRRTLRRRIFPRHCSAPHSHMENTRSELDKPTRPGPIGMPST